MLQILICIAYPKYERTLIISSVLNRRIIFVLLMLAAIYGISYQVSLGATVAPISADVRDSASGEIIPCRLYVRGADGTWHFPVPSGLHDVVRYERANYWDKTQVEMHATLAAKPFKIDLPAGEYTVVVERGKDYLPLTRKITVDESRAEWHLGAVRWIDMASRGWYSGDLHCHRRPDDLANLMLAEDLNVCFPLTYWTTIAELPPSRGDKTADISLSPTPVKIDATHVWYPCNTEYEIFKVGGKGHTLGAFLILNHRSPFQQNCLPLSHIAEQARNEGALIDLEKHNWEWSAVAAPTLPVELFELANNHNWRIGFGVKNWGAPAPKWLKLSGPRNIDNESDWLEYGCQFYYGLLNCGLEIKPAAGTASGAHPVPLGYSRVYVHLPNGFNYDAWLDGLKAGRSFVSTGPMLIVSVNDRDPGEKFQVRTGEFPLHVRGEALSPQPLERIEIVWNGEIIRSVSPENKSAGNGFKSRIDVVIPADSSGWIAVRCVGQRLETGGIPFAHTGPWHVELAGRPLKPKRREVEYFLDRVNEEIERNRGVLSEDQLVDYHKARDFWRQKLEVVKNSKTSSE
jgi:hypothetical protein